MIPLLLSLIFFVVFIFLFWDNPDAGMFTLLVVVLPVAIVVSLLGKLAKHLGAW